MVDWTTEPGFELKVDCGASAAGAVAEIFAHYGFTQEVTIEETAGDGGEGNGVTLTPGRPVTVRTVLSASDVPPEALQEARLSLWLVRQALWVKGRTLPIGTLRVAERPAEAWAQSLEERFSVHAVTDRFRVKAPHHDYAPQPGETVIELGPGTAFGTGLHRSTQLSLKTLEEELAVGDHVLDVGVGAGLLAIAAAQLGARAVDCLDIDPEAIRAARENAERNGVGKIMRVALGTVGPDAPFPGPFNLVIANIIAGVLIELAPGLARAVAPGGTLIVGGIIDDKEAMVHEAFALEHLILARRIQSEDWVALVWKKPR